MVAAENHREAAEEIIPKWWGLAVATNSPGGVLVTQERRPEMNTGLDAATLASLLWRDEALTVLERYNAARGVRSKPREVLYERLAVALDLDIVRAEVRATLKARAGW